MPALYFLSWLQFYNISIKDQDDGIHDKRANKDKHCNCRLSYAAFEYLGCNMTYDYDNDADSKMNRFSMIPCGTMQRELNKTRQDSRSKLYETMAVVALT